MAESSLGVKTHDLIWPKPRPQVHSALLQRALALRVAAV